ncbi:MAG: orotidine-5'-phosphate decarboxylase [Candidatus Fermentibacteraceae bacterium]|nr:orotidine-5'-phosphate decarboxylase [Candidatus Fermentibacteraceae bacterium]
MSDVKLYVALTSDCGSDALKMLKPLQGLPVGVKVGLELFVKEGPGIVGEIRNAGFPVFLDLKFHDIPYTVAGAVRSACLLEPDVINVHASGGRAMMEAAADACTGKTRIIAVTVLTSMDKSDLQLLGSGYDPLEAVVSLAAAAEESGLHGVVCSPLEASAVSRNSSRDFLIITPGVRPAQAKSEDQKRVMTPFEAVRNGATSLVVGRPITGSSNPAQAARSILQEIDTALAN